MQPGQLSKDSFKMYPPLARKLAIDHLALMRELPLVLTAILLREIIQFDTCFPQERSAIEARLTFLTSLSGQERHLLTQGFSDLSLPDPLTTEDWVDSPRKFEENLSAHLWASHQIDAFHATSEAFLNALRKSSPAPKASTSRWAVVVLGPGLHKESYPLFRKLRPHGVYFSEVDSSDGTAAILRYLARRAEAFPYLYGHWYVDGGNPLPTDSSVISSFSWGASTPIRQAVLHKVQSVVGSGSGGPEMLRTIMADWEPGDRVSSTNDPLIDNLVQRIYDEGSGTQIFSTTFVQWSAREILKRAEPVSLVARFGPRQRQRTLNELFTAPAEDMDYSGSAVDADLGAYYTWMNLGRLEGSDTASFIAWSEDSRQAVAIGPGFPRGTEAAAPIAMERLLEVVSKG
jgi:hypothetical protein